MATRYALTTVDNPFNPFDQFDEWLVWDTSAGYNTIDYIGRISTITGELSEADQDEAMSDNIDSILEEHGNTFYKKVSQEYSSQYD